MAEMVTRVWKNGKCVEESRCEVDWEPNAADLDLITVGCECGNTFDIPWDAIAFGGFEGMHCGQCGKAGKMKVLEDPVNPDSTK